MRSIKSRFFGLFAGGALIVGLLASAPARAQVAPVAGYEGEADVYVQPGEEVVTEAAPQGAFSFVGGHPIPHDQGGGFCQAQGAHQHGYGPFDHHLFREVNGAYAFIGDPADFGYSAPYQYAGHHPIAGHHGGGYCYIGWSHRHLFAPVGVGFALTGGVYNYVGTWGSDYYAPRLAWASYYDNYYRANYWGGRYWTVRPRPVHLGFGWRGYGARPYWAPAYRPVAPVYAPRPVYAPAYRPVAPVYAPRPVYAPAAPAYRPVAAPVHAPRPAYVPAPAAYHGGHGWRR